MKITIGTAIALLIAGAAEAGSAVGYSADETSFEGYFAPAQDARATVVILPTWKGISDYEKDRAEMLAEIGYDAFVGDLHGKGKLPRTMEEKAAAHDALFADSARLEEILRATIATAEDLGGPDILVMGYSMGGGAAMEIVRSGLGADMGIDGYAIFSGRVSDPAGRMIPEGTAPIFVAHGEADTRIPVSQLVNFRDDLEMANVAHRIETYPGAGHLFSAFGFPNYDLETDQKSWAAFTEFLNTTFAEDKRS